MNYRTINNNKGFGLLEVLVSISVVIVGILPMVNLFNSVLARERDTENKLKAIYFAQEGIEIVRQIRDTNWKKGDAWDYEPESGNSFFDESEWEIRMDDCSSFKFKDFKLEASDSSNTKIYYAGGKPYAQGCSNGRVATGFTRTVSIDNKDYSGAVNNNYMKITSVIKLDGTEIYSLTSYLNKWQ